MHRIEKTTLTMGAIHNLFLSP